MKKQTTESTAEETATPRKERKSRIEVSGGNTISAEISSAPISRIPSTMVTAASTASSIL